MDASRAPELSAALWLAFDGGRAYPPEHGERIRREQELCEAIAALAARGSRMEVDFVAREVRIDDEASPLASPLFDDMVDAGLMAGFRRVELDGDRDGLRALGLLSSLVETSCRAAVDRVEPPARVTDTQPVVIDGPAAPALPPGAELAGRLEEIWNGIGERRTIDRAALDDLLARLDELPGDGVDEPVRLFDESDPARRCLDHALNVARIVRIAASCAVREAGIDRGEDVDDITAAALFADIGMLAVSRDLQAREEELAPLDVKRMQRHPVLGARLLLATPGLPEIAGVVAFEHHMRAGGRGYPEPPRPGWVCRSESRLVQAADTWAAIRAARPWRASLGETEARQLMRQLAGAWLDRESVSLLLDRALPAGCVVHATRGSRSGISNDPG